MTETKLTTHCKLNPDLASILRKSPASPSDKLRAVSILRGETFSEFARRLNINKVSFSMTINNRLVSPSADRLKIAVAEDLGVTVDDIWTPAAETAAA
jgi:transcriptional regulator with XRE-family HTH domain